MFAQCVGKPGLAAVAGFARSRLVHVDLPERGRTFTRPVKRLTHRRRLGFMALLEYTQNAARVRQPGVGRTGGHSTTRQEIKAPRQFGFAIDLT
jgi:hypothetical protein